MTMSLLALPYTETIHQLFPQARDLEYMRSTILTRTSSHKSSDPKLKYKSSWRLLVATISCSTIFAATIVFVARDVVISRASQFPNDRRTLYITLVTSAATILSLSISRAYRDQWLCEIDSALLDCTSRKDIERLQRSWRSVLGLATLKERFTIASTWTNQICYLAIALLTTAIVAATIPTLSTSSKPFRNIFLYDEGNPCITYIGIAQASLKGYEISNRLTYQHVLDSNGEQGFDYQDFLFNCPCYEMSNLLYLVNKRNPQAYAYADHDVAVQASAIGSHQSLYLAFPDVYNAEFKVETGLNRAVVDEGDDLLETSQCGPVMLSNPVSCKPIVAILAEDGSVTASEHSCTLRDNGRIDPDANGTIKTGFCPDTSVGTGTILIVASGLVAFHLALSMDDFGWVEASANKHHRTDHVLPLDAFYGISCEVDIPSSLAWRELTMTYHNPFTPDIPYRQVLSGGAECKSDLGDKPGLVYATTAASGLLSSLGQVEKYDNTFGRTVALAMNRTTYGNTEYFNASNTDGIRTSGYAFKNSANGLEDTLGLAAALAMSRVNMVEWSTQQPVKMAEIDGNLTIAVYRVGTGQRFALMYAIPPLIATIFGVHLLLNASEAPSQYASSNMLDLITFGYRVEPQILAKWPGALTALPGLGYARRGRSKQGSSGDGELEQQLPSESLA